MKPKQKVEEWAFATNYHGTKVLVGRLAQDHTSRLGDHLIKGHRVVTSAVVSVNPDNTVETRNSLYELVGPRRGQTVQDLLDEGKYFGLEVLEEEFGS